MTEPHKKPKDFPPPSKDLIIDFYKKFGDSLKQLEQEEEES